MERYSYPRTFHLPFSKTVSSDDKRLKDCSCFEGKDVIVTEKRDGENTTMYPDGYVHARSIDGTGKEYQSVVIKRWREIAHDIPKSWHVCAENMYARHSIAYDNLKEYFEIFGIFEGETCLGWDMVEYFASMYDLQTVPVLYRGPWNEKAIKYLCSHLDTSKVEGVVVRNMDSFPVDEFGSNVAKYVRANHVTTDEHWTRSWVKNNLETE